MSREVNMIGMAIAKGLEERGQVGATHMGTAFDAWYPGYVDYAPNLQEHRRVLDRDRALSIRDAARIHDQRFPAEHARPAAAEPLLQPVDAGLVAAPRRGRLHGDGVAGGDRVRVEVQGLAALSTAIRPGAIRSRSGATKAPFAYVVPQEQRDPVAAVELLRRLAFGGVRVSELTARRRSTANVPAGTWVIPTDQEFAAMAREVLDVAALSRSAPVSRRAAGTAVRRRRLDAAAADGRPRRRRDRAARRRGAREDEAARPVPEPRVKPAPYERGAQTTRRRSTACPGVGFDTDAAAAAIVPPAGRVTGSGAVLLARSGAEQRVSRAQPRLEAAARPCSAARTTGAPIRRISGLSDDAQNELVKSLALQAERASPRPARAVQKPRIGLFRPWTGSMDEGWTRWVLEQYGFALRDAASRRLQDAARRARSTS